MTFDEKLTRRYGLRIGGGRTRIRTRVFGLEGQSDIQLHYTSLTNATAYSSRRLQSIRVVERTSHNVLVYAQFAASIQTHNVRMTTIGQSDYQERHLSFYVKEANP